jgi:serine/threonine protein phosphatase
MEYYIDDFIEAEIEVKYFYKGDNSKRFVLGEVIGPNPLICFGVNPSTAKVQNGALKTDPTILKIKKFVEKRNCDGWIMLNLYAQVTPEPNELHKNEDFDNCLHKKNINKIKEIFENYPNADILACWGNLIEKRDYLKKLCLKEIFEISEKDRNWLYIGNLTKKGNPRHPLYASIDTNLEVFNIKDYIKNL